MDKNQSNKNLAKRAGTLSADGDAVGREKQRV
jgi:hypothetical protein